LKNENLEAVPISASGVKRDDRKRTM